MAVEAVHGAIPNLAGGRAVDREIRSQVRSWSVELFLVARMLLVVRPGGRSSLLVVRPGAPFVASLLPSHDFYISSLGVKSTLNLGEIGFSTLSLTQYTHSPAAKS